MKTKKTTQTLPKSLPIFFWLLIKRYKWSFIFSCSTLVAVVSEHSIFPYLSKLIIDGLATYQNNSSIFYHLRYTLIWGAGIWIGIDVIWRLGGFALSSFRASIETYIKEYLTLKCVTQRHEFFTMYQSGDLLGRILELSKDTQSLIEDLMYFIIPCGLNIVVAIIMAFFVHPLLAGCITIWIICHSFVSFFAFKKQIRLASMFSDTANRFNGVLQDSLGNHTAIKSFGTINSEEKILNMYAARQLKSQKRAFFAFQWTICALNLISFIANGLIIIGVQLWLFQQGKMTIGDMVMIVQLIFHLVTLVSESTIIFGTTIQNYGKLKKDFEISDDIIDLHKVNIKKFHVNRGEIEFQNVSFDYIKDESDKILMNYNMKIPAGQKIGIVGTSGSGKSTLINLIMRNYDIDQGQMLIDDIDVSKFSQQELMHNITYIPQNPTLFNRSMWDNISYGNPDAEEWRVIEAAKIAGIHDDIIEMEDGYDTFAGESGSQLSGGQRQRIAIARAILKDARIIILDEATSALDVETERDIRNAMVKVMENKTAIVIAHRLSTVALLDRIIVFEDGEIVEDGTHDELMEIENGKYKSMVEMHIEDLVE